MLPGLGVGGYCLTKDPLLASWARMNLFNSSDPLLQSEKGVRINDKMPLYAFEYLQSQYQGSLSGKKVLLLGVSYLNDVGDTRYTPVEGFYNQLEAAGAIITLHDPHVLYWEEKDTWITQDLTKLLEQEKQEAFIYDTIGVLTNEEIGTLSGKHKVRVLGRGDLQQ